MKKFVIFSFLTLIFIGCSFKDKYDVARYYNVPEQDRVLTQIVTYVFDAPPLTRMEDRFAPKHYNYYSFVAKKFSLEKYYIADNGIHYFYILRPGPGVNTQRGTGGYFRMDKDSNITQFHEVYVTPLFSETVTKEKCEFLFDEMVKGSIDKFLPMESFVAWPNQATYYDTIKYQWQIKPELSR